MLESIRSIYFHELENREKIFARLQLNFALYASYFAIVVYIVRVVDYESNFIAITLFYVGLFFSLFLVGFSIYYTHRSLTGLEYRLLPESNEIIEHKEKLENHKNKLANYNATHKQNITLPKPDEDIQKYISKMMAKCSSFNARVNELRRIGIRKSLYFLVLSSFALIFSSIIFIAFDLDASSPRKETSIKNEALTIQIKNLNDKIHSINQFLSAGNTPKKEVAIMPNEPESPESKVEQSPPPPPPPPQAPVEPTWQVSTESFNEPMPSGEEILKEKK